MTANSNKDGTFGVVHRKSRRAHIKLTMVKKEVPVNEHFLVPAHRKLSAEEKQQIMQKYNAEEKQFPKISIKDPAIKIFEPEVGDLIEITRQVLDEDEFYLYYRVVV